MTPLSKTTAGDDCTISWLFGLPEAVEFLRSSSICEGSILHVIRNHAGSVLFRCEGRRFVLDNEVTDRIQVIPCM